MKWWFFFLVVVSILFTCPSSPWWRGSRSLQYVNRVTPTTGFIVHAKQELQNILCTLSCLGHQLLFITLHSHSRTNTMTSIFKWTTYLLLSLYCLSWEIKVSVEQGVHVQMLSPVILVSLMLQPLAILSPVIQLLMEKYLVLNGRIKKWYRCSRHYTPAVQTAKVIWRNHV